MSKQSFPFHDETTALARAPAEQVFAHLDNPKSLAGHMGESSIMMLGSHMSIDVDADGGHAIGSKIRMRGSVMGIPLYLEEVITERDAPQRKVWETIGTPKLLVVAQYRMGFEVTPKGNASLLTIFIDYRLPATAPSSWLGRLLGGAYARWCARRMTGDAVKFFDQNIK